MSAPMDQFDQKAIDHIRSGNNHPLLLGDQQSLAVGSNVSLFKCIHENNFNKYQLPLSPLQVVLPQVLIREPSTIIASIDIHPNHFGGYPLVADEDV
ncbi:unnamed protein product [Didymodactylos carnosus]|uniref:Uncharacterized protein n=1 Tax=Didymodactylos carnosus TaxID=1234261 RepID=A0A815NSA3_9BILA|nr:unnamed protein product [Didymodactylos carnosus]CAF1556856.1 unnamed protein product [Didymodactylos carnosus]CAF4317859.1 unnamed protein product [Didymodactylos carnosus]CAF4347892.1 unnamed protein product [Didymodactylos carnosus]